MYLRSISFFFNKSDRTSYRLIDIPSSVSDHHPIGVNIQCSLQKVNKGKTEKKTKGIKWDKVDKERYQEIINDHIEIIEVKMKVDTIHFKYIYVPDHTRSWTVRVVLRDYRGFKNILQINLIRI